MGLKDLLEAVNLEDELIEATNKAKEKKAPEKEEKNAAPKEEKEVKKAPKTEEKKAPKKEERAVVEKVVVKPKEVINKALENKTEEKPVQNIPAQDIPVQNIHVQNTPSEAAPQMPAIPEIEPRKGMGRPKVYGKRQGINLQLNEENYIKARQWSGFYGSMTAYINALIENDTRPFPQQSSPHNEN